MRRCKPPASHPTDGPGPIAMPTPGSLEIVGLQAQVSRLEALVNALST